MIRLLVVCAVVASACKSEGERSDLGTTEVGGSSTSKPAGSAGGFSATLSAELANGSDTPALAPGSGAMAGSAAAGSGSGTMAGSAAKAGSGAGSASAAMAGSGAGSASAAMAGSAAKAGSGAGSAAPAMTGSAAKAGSGAGSATPAMAGSAAKPIEKPIDKPRPVQVPGDLAAIKISLLPNWVRDVGEAGTISLTVTVQSRDEVSTFKFHYGYDLVGAPTDREQYKKFLMEQKVMAVTADRQRGAAWYLEGVDSDGKGAFRFLISYGGKRLVCYGSLYKDSGLGDIRDEVMIQAKKICETLTL